MKRSSATTSAAWRRINRLESSNTRAAMLCREIFPIAMSWSGFRSIAQYPTGTRRSAAATEAIFLLAREAFDDLGYRRLEWKTNALNQASRRAAERFGFHFEGVFRKHQVVKGRNRDTAWFAITDDEWPALRRAYEEWLAPENFDADGRQLRGLSEVIAAHAGE